MDGVIALAKAKAYVDDVVEAFGQGIKLRGEVDYFAELPSNAQPGDAYTVKYAGTSGTVPDGTEYAWAVGASESKWIALGPDASQLKSLGITNATVGKIVRITAVDEDGKPTAYEAVEPAVYPASIVITTPPDQVNYYNGNTFDPTGIAVTMIYSNGETAAVPVEDLEYAPAVFSPGDTMVTVTYKPFPYTLVTYQPVNVTDIDLAYRARVNNAASKAAVDALFVEWWGTCYTEGADKAMLLDRWFDRVMHDDRVHGAKLPLYATSTATQGELIDDSADLVCEPSTATVAGRDDFAKLPQFWILEVSAERNADGTVSIYAIQHLDNLADVRSGAQHLCMVLTKNTYWREYIEDGYTYVKQSCNAFTGAALWQSANAQGVSYHFAAWPKYMAGWLDDTHTSIGCGTGLAPCCNVRYHEGIALWRERSAYYSGASYRTQKWQQIMFALKYAVKGNSGTIEGCRSYDREYAAAVSETGVERVMVTTAQAANLLVGSSVCVVSGRRPNAPVAIRITSIEDVEIDGTTYGAVYVDNGGVTFDVVAGTTFICTMPYYSGYNDTVLGVDGSRTSYTNGTEPGLIQGTEFMIGACCTLSDAVQVWEKYGTGYNDYYLDLYLCPDPAKAVVDFYGNSRITPDYIKLEGGTLTNPLQSTNNVRDMFPAPACWPARMEGPSGGTTTVGCKAVFDASKGSGNLFSVFAGAYLYAGQGLAGAGYSDFPGRISTKRWYNVPGAPPVTV